MKTPEELKAFEELVIPIHKFLKEKGYAYPTVTITLDRVKISTDEISIPVPYVDHSCASLNDLDRTYKGTLARATSQHAPPVVCGLHGEFSLEKE